MGRLVEYYRRFERFCRHDIWQPLALREHPVRSRVHALMRVASVTVTGLNENHITARAAALSYASLLGLGPLVVIAALVAGLVFNQRDPVAVADSLNRAIRFIAPTVAQYEHLEHPPAAGGAGGRSRWSYWATVGAMNWIARLRESATTAGSRWLKTRPATSAAITTSGPRPRSEA